MEANYAKISNIKILPIAGLVVSVIALGLTFAGQAASVIAATQILAIAFFLWV